jgi:Uncharacterised protein family (UPF0236)
VRGAAAGRGLGGGGAKRGLCAAFQAETVREITALLGPGVAATLDFEALEVACRRQALQVAARLLAEHRNADTSDDAGPALPCPRCGGPARYAGRHAKTFTTALGPLPLTRAYYHCAPCDHGFCPRDRALGVEGGALSPAGTRMVGTAGALVSFAEGSELLGALAGLRVTAKQVERTAEALGREIAADEQRQVVPAPAAELAPTLYLGLDGTGVPMRKAELAGRPGKQADGSSKTREVKLCTVWSAEGRDADGVPVRDDGSVSYSAAIESAAARDTDATGSAFAQRVEREARRRGFDRAGRRAVLGDGAPWIWNIAGEAFPAAIQIVDRFHAKEHLSTVAKVLYGAPSDLGDGWAKARHAELDAGQLSQIVAALVNQYRTRRDATKREAVRKCIGYLWANRRRMRYPAFRAQGLCTSTAVVEAGCKVAIGTRLKRAGMHWSVRGANAIIALRCCKLSGRFEDFWERRAERCAGS